MQPRGHPQRAAGIFYFILFFFPSWGEKINKWQSNTVYANLISHASYVLPRLLGSAQLRLWGKWQCRGLIWVISSVMIMRLSTPFVASTKGHMNKRRFEVQVQMIRGGLSGPPFLSSASWSRYIKACFTSQGESVCVRESGLHHMEVFSGWSLLLYCSDVWVFLMDRCQHVVFSVSLWLSRSIVFFTLIPSWFFGHLGTAETSCKYNTDTVTVL